MGWGEEGEEIAKSSEHKEESLLTNIKLIAFQVLYRFNSADYG